MTKNEDLKSCPLCNSPVRTCFMQITNGKDYWDVSCRRYGHSVLVIADTEHEAIAAWNARPTVTTDDGDADILDKFNTYVEYGSPILETSVIEAIRTALQSTRKPDDVTVSREVLQGVRHALQGHIEIYDADGDYPADDGAKVQYKARKALASLDAVLSEGE